MAVVLLLLLCGSSTDVLTTNILITDILITDVLITDVLTTNILITDTLTTDTLTIDTSTTDVLIIGASTTDASTAEVPAKGPRGLLHFYLYKYNRVDGKCV